MAKGDQVESYLKEINTALERAVTTYARKNGGDLPPVGTIFGTPLNNLTEKQVMEHERMADQQGRMAAVQRQFHKGSEVSGDGHAVTWKTPFDEIAEMEETLALGSDEEARIFMEGAAWLIGFLFHDGPHPAYPMRRLYCWVKKFHPHLIWDMGFRNLAKLVGESHGAMQWRIEVLIDEYMRAKGLSGVRAPWQRSSEARAKCAENSKGNSNRVGGKRSAKHKSKNK